jgi:hypothetical protein
MTTGLDPIPTSRTLSDSRPRIARPSVSGFFATFGYAWLTIGFFTGTLVLVVAVRGILSILQKLGWGQSAQNRLFLLVILLFVIGSFLLARRVVRALYRQSTRTRRVALALLGIPAVLSGYAWSNPTRFLSGLAGTTSTTLSMAGGPSFIFGSYPDDNQIRELKKKGVTAIVSLQSPAVVVEISGISEERKSAAREGMQFIEAPMLPWVSDNTESIEKIRQLALTGKGTYYVHCGLGRDRVNIAKRVIESVMPQTTRLASTNSLKEAITFERRTEPFERGMPMRVMHGVWVVPSLNKEEFYGFIIQGQPGHVIIAMNPADTAQKSWLADAEKNLKQYALRYTVVPYPAANGDTSTAAIVAMVKAEKPPFTVIVPKTTFTVGDPKDPVARAIAKAYNVQVQPMPKKVELTAGERPDLVVEPGVKR